MVIKLKEFTYGNMHFEKFVVNRKHTIEWEEECCMRIESHLPFNSAESS